MPKRQAMRDTSFLSVSEEAKTKLEFAINWTAKAVIFFLPVIGWLWNENLNTRFSMLSNETARILTTVESQQASINTLIGFAAEGERFTAKDGESLKLWVENHLFKNVPPPEVKLELERLASANRSLQNEVDELQRELAREYLTKSEFKEASK